jgi:hypothetical protein
MTARKPAPAALAARYGLSPELANRLAGIDAVTEAVIDLPPRDSDAQTPLSEGTRRPPGTGWVEVSVDVATSGR